MFRPPFLSLSPELDALEMKLMLARDPSQDEMVRKALADAEALLVTVDKTKINEYVAIMQQVIVLRQRLSSTDTRDQLMAQKVTLLEALLTPPSQA